MEKKKFLISIDEDIYEKIEEFRFSNRCSNRNNAVVELIKKGLDFFINKKNIS